jgi:hypothetical protein
MFELEALGDNGIINYTSAINTPTVTVTQSSTLEEYAATNAIDGDMSTFSHTESNTGKSEWWQVDLGVGVYHTIASVRIANRWCGSPDDEPACLCRLSQAKVWLFDENLQLIWGGEFGDTCGLSELVVEFIPDAKFCEEVVATSPIDMIEAGVCRDNPSFITTRGEMCSDVALKENKAEVCAEEATLETPLVAQMTEPFDENGNFWQIHHFCPLTCGDCVSTEAAVDVEGAAETIASAAPETFGTIAASAAPETTRPTYSPSYLPSSQPVAATVNFGHAYSAGDACEDDATFVSNKGITCQSFAYDETVHCRAPTGYRDEDFNSLRYSDYCPKTCGVCSVTGVSASSAANEGVDTKGVALGVGLTTFFSLC